MIGRDDLIPPNAGDIFLDGRRFSITGQKALDISVTQAALHSNHRSLAQIGGWMADQAAGRLG